MLKKGNCNKLTALVFVFVFVFYGGVVYAEDVTIEIIADNIIGKINPLVFGTNVIAPYAPSGNEYRGYSNYGAGIWDPKKRQSVTDVINLAKDLRIPILRFPGSSPNYDWKKTIGPTNQRPNFLYGLDEFLKTAEEIGSEVVYTFPYFTGTVEDAADLVEYLNAECDGKNPGGGIDWANERARNGHPQPYNVKYFELGGEVNFGVPQMAIPGADPVIYAEKYLEYRKAMKAVDSSVLLGASTENSGQVRGISAWNNKVFEIAGSSMDFLIEHTYRPGATYNDDDKNVDINRLFKKTLESLPGVEKYYRKLSGHFETVAGRKNIPIAVTEYNGGFVQEKPVPFRHSLGTALFNAGLLQIFMKPENNILMGTYWQYVNSYWGMIKNNKFMQGKGTYIKRPNYYTFEMFSRHFGSELLDVRIADTISGENSVPPEGGNLLSGIGWKREIVFGASIDVKKDDTVEIEFDSSRDLNFHHIHKKVSVKPDTTYVLSGYLRAENLKDYEGVCLTIVDGRGWQYNADTTDRVWGTTDWIRVEKEYTTLKDEKDLNVILRRISGKGGPVSGRVYARDIRLTEKSVYKSQTKDSLMVSSSVDRTDNTYYVMVLNKNILEDIRVTLSFNKSNLSKKVTAWTLNGPEIWSTNEIDPATVAITEKSVEMTKDNQLDYVFPAHSLTSLQFKTMQ
ncbi:hypothetical protein C4544_03390 [candidate division WS5 bacterium]|uniref:non-reducing end alpha-L-arabinofuranosidase n=1 Tax=candidate division WS5 bacterium TaxID=2093353 RepID=A0A419DDN6_9BACT|nr:MAG: hypothetical protein C4544_03390 [candidate division WS5 bacterium]